MDSYPDFSGQPEPPQPINPSPPGTTQSHPPYSEMIVAAIVGLKDKDGSSRQAIAKFIEKQYGPANLPPTHSNLLTHHLKRMKTEGQLVMVKHSYMLSTAAPRSAPFQPELQLQPPGFGDYEVSNTDDTYAAGFKPSDMVSPRRKPGRPPKPKHQDFGFQGEMPADLQQQEDIQPYQPQFEQQHHFGNLQDFQSHAQYAGGSGTGQETFQDNYAGDGSADGGGGAEPIFASLGLADEGGIPPTAPQPPPPPENAVVSAKRGRGRPPKNASRGRKSVVSGSGGIGNGGDVGEPARRKPGRPKMLSVSMVNGGGVKRGGRPKRVGGPVTVPLPGNVNKPSGRPKRVVSKPEFYVSASGSDAQTRPVSTGHGRGRPAKNKFRKLSSQSFGHPSKVGQGTAVLVTDPQQLVAYQELKSKYEHLQSKAKEVVGVIRPYINPEYEAFGALQELETMVGTAVNVQSENPPPFV